MRNIFIEYKARYKSKTGPVTFRGDRVKFHGPHVTLFDNRKETTFLRNRVKVVVVQFESFKPEVAS